MSSATLLPADKSFVPLDGEKIKALREKRGLTQDQAALAAGLPGKARWSAIEQGKANITIKTLDQIARALGVKAKDLLK